MAKPSIYHPHSFKDETGNRYGRLTVITRVPNDQAAMWLCICTCGKQAAVRGKDLRQGQVSCGCFRRERTKERATTHGCSRDARGARTVPEYNAWENIKNRCLRIKNKYYPNYGGKGITIHDSWLHNFQAFFDHIGSRPSPKHSVDRIDNALGYEPGNVRWATRTVQCRNKSNNIFLEFHGERRLLVEWAESLGMNRRTLVDRVKHYGWTTERALTTPVRTRGSLPQ